MKLTTISQWIASIGSVALVSCSSLHAQHAPLATQTPAQYIDLSQWQLAWNDEFDYDNAALDNEWLSQNGPTENPWVLSSRWRDNAVVKDGVLHLENRKESRGGQDWTSGNVWTKRTFGYGYFEARYKYAGAYGTNNSFWFWPKQGVADGEKACEIDINEGHYPNIINTNVHNWTDKYTLPNGRVSHSDNQLHHTVQGDSFHHIPLDKPIQAYKLRLTSTNPASIHLIDFRALAPSDHYPEIDKALPPESVDHATASDTHITSSGHFKKMHSEHSYATDGRLDTRWVSNKGGKKWLELRWDEPKTLGAVQINNGWPQEFGPAKGLRRNLMADFTLEYFDGEQWHAIANYDAATQYNYADEYHTYGLEWDEDYFHFYFDGQRYYSMRNDVCFSETTLLFSLAILKADIAGPVTDAIDGTGMKIDWVRYYTRKANGDNP